MATSGSVDYTLNRNRIIASALRKLGALAQGETPTNEEYDEASENLNMMIKHWQTQGLKLWTRTEGVLIQAASQESYTLGPNSTDHATTVDDLVKTEIATAGVIGDLTIDVDSITGISTGDVIGIKTSSTDIHWTTVNGAPTGTTITITAPLDAAVAVDNEVYAYTSVIERPLKIMKARVRNSDDSETPIDVVVRDKYFNLTLKSSTGRVNTVYYDPQIDDGVLYVWPTADDVTDQIRFTFKRQIEDMDAAANNFDFPAEWFLTITYNLAVVLNAEYDNPLTNDFKQDAAAMLRDLMAYNTEGTLTFIPDFGA